MTAGRFACLRTHSWHSLREGTAPPHARRQRPAACGYQALVRTATNRLTGAVEFVAATRSGDVRPILGAHLVQQSQRATALIAEPAGYHSLCRALSRLHFGKDATLAQLLAENPEGLHVRVDDPFLLKPPLTDAFRRRLWLEVGRPGKSAAGDAPLLAVGGHRALP